jgi:hypothetical protein
MHLESGFFDPMINWFQILCCFVPNRQNEHTGAMGYRSFTNLQSPMSILRVETNRKCFVLNGSVLAQHFGEVQRMRFLARLPSSSLVRVIIFIGLPVAAVGEHATGASTRHVECTYTVSASVTVVGVTIFHRSDVGGGYASLDENGTTADRNIRLRFLSGTTPDRAHGLNRLGFLEEHVHETNGRPVAVDYFGFITANPERSLTQARAALSAESHAGVCLWAAQGSSRRGAAYYQARDLLLPAHYKWRQPAELIQEVSSRFGSSPTPTRRIPPPQDSETTKSFLYALIVTMKEGASKREVPFMSNGRI